MACYATVRRSLSKDVLHSIKGLELFSKEMFENIFIFQVNDSDQLIGLNQYQAIISYHIQCLTDKNGIYFILCEYASQLQ